MREMESEAKAVIDLKPELISVENFAEYGQLISPIVDDDEPHEEARLELDRGTPRFYIMRLKDVGLKFHRIARHDQCTQCLGALNGKEWFMVVAPPPPAEQGAESPVPNRSKLKAFRIPGDCYIKLERGTWHAGPLFPLAENGTSTSIDFYNLELMDTNTKDFHTYDFAANHGIEYRVVLND